MTTLIKNLTVEDINAALLRIDRKVDTNSENIVSNVTNIISQKSSTTTTLNSYDDSALRTLISTLEVALNNLDGEVENNADNIASLRRLITAIDVDYSLNNNTLTFVSGNADVGTKSFQLKDTTYTFSFDSSTWTLNIVNNLDETDALSVNIGHTYTFDFTNGIFKVNQENTQIFQCNFDDRYYQKSEVDALINNLSNSILNVSNRVSTIESYIPSAASCSNQLADKNFVTSSISSSVTPVSNRVSTIESYIPDEASATNKLADKCYVNNCITPVANRVNTVESYIPTGTSTTNQLVNKCFVESSIETVSDRVDTIESYIPSAASASNQLADKCFVNSSISTATATFRGTYNTLAELENVSGDANDYAFVKSYDESTHSYHYDRYKWTSSGWEYEWTINNTGFTSDQWESINSGITCNLVSKITDVYNPTITLSQNGASVGSFTLNQSSGETLSVTDKCVYAEKSTLNYNRPLLGVQCVVGAANSGTCFAFYNPNIYANFCTGRLGACDFQISRGGLAQRYISYNSCAYTGGRCTAMDIAVFLECFSKCHDLKAGEDLVVHYTWADANNNNICWGTNSSLSLSGATVSIINNNYNPVLWNDNCGGWADFSVIYTPRTGRSYTFGVWKGCGSASTYTVWCNTSFPSVAYNACLFDGYTWDCACSTIRSGLTGPIVKHGGLCTDVSRNILFASGNITEGACCQVYYSCALDFKFNTCSGLLTTPHIQLGTGSSTASAGLICARGTCLTSAAIRFLNNTVDAYGNGVLIGANGVAILGAGESPTTVWTNLNGSSCLYGGCAGNENLFLTSDNTIYFYSSVNSGMSSAKLSYISNGNYYGNVCGESCYVSKTLFNGPNTSWSLPLWSVNANCLGYSNSLTYCIDANSKGHLTTGYLHGLADAASRISTSTVSDTCTHYLLLESNDSCTYKAAQKSGLTYSCRCNAFQAGIFKTFDFFKDDNAGKKVFQLLYDITSWYNGSTNISAKGLNGIFTGSRVGGFTYTYQTAVSMMASYGRNGATLDPDSGTLRLFYNDINNSGSLVPVVVKRTSDNTYWLALVISGSNHNVVFSGYATSTPSFCTVCYTGSDVPNGYEILLTGKNKRIINVYCGSTCKCGITGGGSLCLSANAFNTNAQISTTTYPGACCTGTLVSSDLNAYQKTCDADNKYVFKCTLVNPSSVKRYALIKTCVDRAVVGVAFGINYYSMNATLMLDNTYNYYIGTDYGCLQYSSCSYLCSNCNCFWLTYNGWRAPVLCSAQPFEVICTVTTAPTGVTFKSFCNGRGDIDAAYLGGRSSIQYFRACTGASIGPDAGLGYYANMTTSSGLSGNWTHILNMAWGAASADPWQTQIALPTHQYTENSATCHLHWRTHCSDQVCGCWRSWNQLIDNIGGQCIKSNLYVASCVDGACPYTQICEGEININQPAGTNASVYLQHSGGYACPNIGMRLGSSDTNRGFFHCVNGVGCWLQYWDTDNTEIHINKIFGCSTIRGTTLYAGSSVACTSTTAGATGSSYGAGWQELYHSTPYIDFHHNMACADYSARIIQSTAGRLDFAVNNATGCTASTCSYTFCLCRDGTIYGNKFSGSLLCYCCNTLGPYTGNYDRPIVISSANASCTTQQTVAMGYAYSCPLTYNPAVGRLCTTHINLSGGLYEQFNVPLCVAYSWNLNAGSTYYLPIGCIQPNSHTFSSNFNDIVLDMGGNSIVDSINLRFSGNATTLMQNGSFIIDKGVYDSGKNGITGIGIVSSGASWTCPVTIWAQVKPNVTSAHTFKLYRNMLDSSWATNMSGITTTAPSFCCFICTNSGNKPFHWINGTLNAEIGCSLSEYANCCSVNTAMGTCCLTSLVIASTSQTNPTPKEYEILVCSSCDTSCLGRLKVEILNNKNGNANINARLISGNCDLFAPYRVSYQCDNVVVDFAATCGQTLYATVYYGKCSPGSTQNALSTVCFNSSIYCCSWTNSIAINTSCSYGASLFSNVASNVITACCIATTSALKYKKNIIPYTDSALDLVRNTDIYCYLYKNEPDNALPHIGIIADWTCEILSGKDQNQFRLAETVGVLLKAVKELDEKTQPWYKKLFRKLKKGRK